RHAQRPLPLAPARPAHPRQPRRSAHGLPDERQRCQLAHRVDHRRGVQSPLSMETIASISTFDGRDETGEVAANADRVNVLIYVDASVSLLVALSDLDATSSHFSVMIGAQ